MNDNNDMRQMTQMGRSIEEGSFAIIDSEVGEHSFPEEQWQIVRRVIHATADFDFQKTMAFHRDAVASGIAALRRGCPIVVDVRMIEVGLNRARLDHYGCSTHCMISDQDVIDQAKAEQSTRAIMSMRKAAQLGLLHNAIVAVGNAPTALIEVARLSKEPQLRPALVLGVPVGFVSAVESKQEIMESSAPWIVARGRKGGSTIAVAILHALLYLSAHENSVRP